jgi:hemerythrin
VKWSDTYSTGLKHLDDQHKMLFRMSEDYREAPREGHGERMYGVMLTALERYAKAHFKLEEQCMYRYRCPAGRMNTQAHAGFIKTLARFQDRYAASGFSRAEAHRLVEYVDQWLADHIGWIDARLRPLVGSSPLNS